MANSFEEFLKQSEGQSAALSVPATATDFDRFLQSQDTGQPLVATPFSPEPEDTTPFFERNGLIQTILKPAYHLGQDIAAFLPEGQKNREAVDNLSKYVADSLKRTDLTNRQKQIIANISDDLPALQETVEAPTAEEAVGDLIGTAALAVSPAVFVEGIGAGFINLALRGAITGGTIGAASAMSENKSLNEVVKSGLIGAGVGVPLEIGGAAAIKGGQFIFSKVAEKLKPLITNFAESQPVKFISSIGARLKQFGDDGVEIAEKFLGIDTKALRRTGDFMGSAMEKGMFNLSKEESYQLIDALEGRLKLDELSPSVRASFNVADDLRKKIAQEAEELKLSVRSKAGTSAPFKARENYYPHIAISADDIVDKNQIFEDSINNSLRLNLFPNREEAIKVAESYAQFIEQNGRGGEFWVNWLVSSGQAKTKDEARGMTLRFFQKSRLPQYGFLERAREFNFPFYDPDPRRVLPKYALGALKRLSTVEAFGTRGQELNKLIGRIRRVQGPEAGQEVTALVKALTESIKSSPKAERVSMVLRALQVPKLAFSQITNLGQGLTNTSLASTLPTAIRGYFAAFTDKGFLTALKTGSTLESIINEVSSRAGAENAFSTKFLKYVGFSASERLNRTAAANTGAIYASDTARKLITSGGKQVFKDRLKELGVDAEAILQKGIISPEEVLTAAKNFVDKTQFRSRPIDLPAFVQSPYGKLVFQFKNFAFNQTKFLKNELKKEAASGNWGRFTRDLIILGTVFPMTGEVLADVRSLITGSKRPTNAFDRYLDDLSYAGGFGLLGDLVKSASLGTLSDVVLGPAVSQGVKNTEILTKAVKNGKLSNSDKRFLINQFGITSPIGNRLYPPQTPETETFFQTLQEVFND